jgi:hypothetical protein
MRTCEADGYPMVPVREAAAGGIAWGCTNPWHPRAPEPCPACGHAGRPRSPTVGGLPVAVCPACRHQWVPTGP